MNYLSVFSSDSSDENFYLDYCLHNKRQNEQSILEVNRDGILTEETDYCQRSFSPFYSSSTDSFSEDSLITDLEEYVLFNLIENAGLCCQDRVLLCENSSCDDLCTQVPEELDSNGKLKIIEEKDKTLKEERKYAHSTSVTAASNSLNLEENADIKTESFFEKYQRSIKRIESIMGATVSLLNVITLLSGIIISNYKYLYSFFKLFKN